MSIRFRLTLLYTAILAVTLLAFGVVLYVHTRQNDLSDIDQSLSAPVSRAQPGGLVFPSQRDAGQPSDTPSTQESGRQRPDPRLSFAAGRLGDPNVLVQLLDGNRQVIYRSPGLNEEQLPQPRSLARHYENVTVNHVPLRVLVWPLGRDDRPRVGGTAPGATLTGPFTILLARSLSDMNDSLSRLRFFLLVGSAVCLAVAAAAGWLLARNALQPIARLIGEARDIGARQDFKRRVRHHGPEDEVGTLASTFNTMLDGLDSAHERMRLALDAQRRFVADASHELRTPLTTIRGNVELLCLEGSDAADQQEALQDIATEAERMSRLVNNLLALARADSGLRIPRAPVLMQPLLLEAVQKARRLADGVVLVLDDNAAAEVLGSRDYLLQLLLILLDNALKYSPDGGMVRVSSVLAGPHHDTLEVAISDRGPGIAPEHQARIFDRFYRADPSRHGEGTGLGLSIARWIAEESGGGITLTSAPGAGSTFTIFLPAAPVSADRGLLERPLPVTL